MKRIKASLMSVLLCMLLAVTAACSGGQAVLADIEIESLPDKIEYVVGETFLSDGLAVNAVYSDGGKEDVTDEAELSSPDMTTVGTKIVTVTYEGKSKTFNISVTSRAATKIEIETLPTKIEYLRTEEFDPSGMKVKATFEDGTADYVTNYTISAVDMTVLGTKQVVVYYGDATATFNIEVKNNPACPQISFEPFTDEEAKFMYEDFGSNQGELDDHSAIYRFADGYAQKPGADIKGNYWIYCVNAGSKISDAALYVTLGGNYRVGISFDKTNWQQIDKWSGADDYNRTPATYEYDLTELVDGFSENAGVMYIRFYSAEDMGFGGFLVDFRLDYTLNDPSLFEEAVGYPDDETPVDYKGHVSFKADGNETERKYLTSHGSSSLETFSDESGWNCNVVLGTTYRTCGKGENDYFVYCFDVQGKMSNAKLTYQLAGDTAVSVSTDNATWFELTRPVDGEGDTPYLLASYEKVLEREWAGFSANSGKLYAKVYSCTDYWAGVKFLDLSLDYVLEGVDDEYPEVIGENGSDDPSSPVSQTIAFDCDGNATELQYLTSDGSSILETFNDANGWNCNVVLGTTFRTCGKGADDHFVYCFELGGKIAKAKLSYEIAGDTMISVSTDNATWFELTKPAEGNGDEPYLLATYTKTLESDWSGFAENTGVIYVKVNSCTDYWAGVRMVSLSLEYTLED